MRLQVDRRTLLKGAAVAAAAALSPVAVRGKDDVEPPIVDTHQHLWDLDRFRLPWLDRAGDVLNRTHSRADYLKAAEGLGVVRTVYMEVNVEPRQRDAEADYVLDLCRRSAGSSPNHGALLGGAVIGGAPEHIDFPQYISRFKADPFVKGVRSSFDAGLASDRFLPNLRLLGDLGLCYDINTGPSGLGRAAKVVSDCPDTHFVLDHCGNLDAAADRDTRATWERGISLLAERKNVVCKISGVMEAASPRRAGPDEYAAVIHHCLDRFGPDRVMFASNWPVVNLHGSFAQWVAVVREATRSRPPSQRRKLFHDNAQAFYHLP
jgi:predicted TIM-barrel fold metal-dependent hydrolase